ncbi:MAG: 50S ribosome-binding GTPase [Bdellovibrionales bacterium]|nr:50S ribosome-binding GTPase [Bdellovibrionales bacterium]
MKSLLSTFAKGRLLKDGLSIVFVGEPNVGKSSLLNKILKEEKAIVTNIAGTTRDVVSGTALIAGVEVSFFDTAGIRDAENEIEKIGISKSYDQLEQADLVFLVIDATHIEMPLLDQQKLKGKNVHIIINKSDLLVQGDHYQETSRELYNNLCAFLEEDYKKDFLWVSALQEQGLDRVLARIIEFIGNDFQENSLVVVSSRQFECLKQCEQSLEATIKLLKENESPEFTAFEVKNAVLAIHRLLGKEYDDQIMDKVFSEFCLGK